ncbi:MAG: T9SS type A sorting domain-containing protein [Saprospiraceae bacterium]
MKNISFALLTCLVGFSLSLGAQPKFNLSFREIVNDGSEYVIEARLSFTATARLASSNFVFNFDATALSSPTYVDGSTDLTTAPFPYYSINVTNPARGRASINVVQNVSGFGDDVDAIAIARIRFTVTSVNGSSDLRWVYNGDGATTGTVVFRDDGGDATTQLNAGTLSNLDGTFLPVEWLYFTAKPTAEGATRLDWATATEINNKKFMVERSADGHSFQDLAEVAGAGTTSVPQYYEALDLYPYPGINYYRLRQEDYDGQFAYSDIVAVTFEQPETHLRVYPNPAANQVSVDLPANQTFRVQLFTAEGKLVREFTDIASSTLRIWVNDLPAGPYQLVVTDLMQSTYQRSVKLVIVSQ